MSPYFQRDTPPPLKLSSGNCCVVYPQLSSRLIPLRTQRATKSKSQFAENPLLPLMMYFALSVELLFMLTRSVGVGSLCPRIVFTFQQTLNSVDSLSLMQSTRAVCIMKDTSSSVFSKVSLQYVWVLGLKNFNNIIKLSSHLHALLTTCERVGLISALEKGQILMDSLGTPQKADTTFRPVPGQ